MSWPNLANLVSCINHAVEGVLRFLKIGYDDFAITGCWANVNTKGASHRMHSHPNNFLSGVYYVQTDHGADTINFHDPRHQTGIIRPPVKELTRENTGSGRRQCNRRYAACFSVLSPTLRGCERERHRSISVSFNVMFTSFTERMSKPGW